MADPIPPTPPTAPNFKRGTAFDPGDGGLGGTTHNVTGDLQTFMGGPTMKLGVTPALNGDGTHKGNTYVVPAGSTHSPLAIPAAVGNGWTRIISGGTLPARGTTVQPADANQLFKLITAATGPLPAGQSDAALGLNVATQGWIIVGAEATHTVTYGRYRLVHLDTIDSGGGFVSRVIVERCYIHPAAGQVDCANSFWVADAEDFQAYDCWVVSGAVSLPESLSTDGKAMFIRRGRRIHIEHNELQGTAENVILGDRYSGSPSLDVTIARNHLFKPLSWFRYLRDGSDNPTWDGVQWLLKNNFEIKVGQRILVVGNHCENNLATYDTGASAQSDQSGDAMTMNAGYDLTDGQPNVSEPIADVEWRSNTVENAVGMFQLSAGYVISDPVNHVPRRIWIHNNLGKHVGGRFNVLNKGWQDTVIEHNTNVPGDQSTLPPSTGFQLYLAGMEWATFDQTGLYPNLRIRRNVFGHCAASWTLKDGGAQMTAARAGTVLPGSDLAENAIIGPVDFAMPAGFTAHASPAAAGINPTTGVLASDSILKFAGSDGRDLGVIFPELQADMDDTPQPPIASFEPSQDPTGLTVQFQDTSV